MSQMAFQSRTREEEEYLLTVENLRTAFFTDKETIHAIDGIDFDIKKGETVGIVGESGSGKSVTARSIMRLIKSPGKILEGSVKLWHDETVERLADKHPGKIMESEDDESGFVNTDKGYVEVTRVPKKPMQKMRGGSIAMVFQDPLSSLNPVYTVGNQIKEALRLHRGLKGKDATDEAINLLEEVGIPDATRRIKEYPHQFSGGMRQRAVIAMAIACDPELLICDEPTTALDVTIQAQILDLLEDLQEEEDVSIMFITHDMGVIAQVSDRVNVMYAGEMIEKAPVDEIFENPKHPYTRGLLKCIPGTQPEGEQLYAIPGDVPTPNEPAQDCRFAERCDDEFEECTKLHPELVDVNAEAENHTAACLLYPEDVSQEEAIEVHSSTGRNAQSSSSEPDTVIGGGEE